jgi:hypothetical protein
VKRNRGSRAGQSLIESMIVVTITCLIFFGLFQISQLYAAKAVLAYTASAAARSRMVGFNDFMVHKVTRAAAIPNAGPIENPDIARGGQLTAMVQNETPGRLWSYALGIGQPVSPQYQIEQSRIPLYLGATRWGELPAILDYENWNDIHYAEGGGSEDLILARARQDYELTWPFVRAFYAGSRVDLDSSGDNTFLVREKHYPLYLEETP